MLRCILMSLALIISVFAFHPAARAADEFEARLYHGPHDKSLPYRLLIPANYDKSTHYPLVIFFHGFGERGTDNKAQLKHCVGRFLKPEMREKYPCFVLATQSPGVWLGIPTFDKPLPASEKPAESLELTLDVLKSLEKEYSIDSRRIYITGASNGGYAVWWLLEHEPKRWAAAVPMCGGGDPSAIHAAKGVPIWAFHGEKDPTVPIARSREMVEALKSAGGHPKFTEYHNTGHMEAAIKAFDDPELFAWMFEQKR